MNYDEYLSICREKYKEEKNIKDTNTLQDFYSETVAVRQADDFSEEYSQAVKSLSDSVKSDFDNRIDCDNDGVMVKHNNIWKYSKEIGVLSDAIANHYRKTKYFCHVYVDKIYVYRTMNVGPTSSYLWHYDNNPHEILKTLVYLTDVSEKNSPFEYLCLKDRAGHGYLGNCTRRGTKMWQAAPNGSRVGEHVDLLVSQGEYEKKKVVGNRGTSISFLNNTYHRVNVLERGYRDVINIRLKPTLVQAPRYADEGWTTGFECSGVVNVDPEKAWTSKI